MSGGDLSRFSLLDLFRQEAEAQVQVLTSGLLALERDRTAPAELEACMRAAHSLKGAARIVNLETGVRLTNAMEDCFVAAQEQRTTLQQSDIDLLLDGVDLLGRLAAPAGQAPDENAAAVDRWVEAINARRTTDDERRKTEDGRWKTDDQQPARDTDRPTEDVSPTHAAPASDAITVPDHLATATPTARDAPDRVLRVTAENLNRLLGLASESLVESRWVKPFAGSLLRLRRMHDETAKAFGDLRETLLAHAVDEQLHIELAAAQRLLVECRQFLAERLAELERFDQRSIDLSHRLYDEALACRMRPFADGLQGFPRMVRDLARSLGKHARLEIEGDATRVDRDILGALDAPLGHLLRNAVDHGLESPEERAAAGKPAEGVVRLEARHNAGALHVAISDDGRGVDMERLREAIVERRLTTREAALALSETEMLEFLFLPGFTMKGTVTDISGRGVGLDVVRNMVKEVHGTVHVSSRAGQGTSFRMQLPVTLSVVRTLLVEVGSEPYAFPLAGIIRTLELAKADVESIEHRQHFSLDGERVGLVTAHQVLESNQPSLAGEVLSVVVVGSRGHAYGLIVDRFLGERELVVQPLDPQLGKIRDIAAGALMEDGSPVLIVDVDDLIQSVDKIVSESGVAAVERRPSAIAEKPRKRVLVVDDSLTVRELERKLIGNRGYDVEVAVDGMDGWNAVRTGRFNLVVTDIDMPRMDGIELVTLINKDPNLKSIPVLVVSYKDRDEDRRRGLEAGAAYYLTKSSFHDETLVQAVVDLIGEPDA